MRLTKYEFIKFQKHGKTCELLSALKKYELLSTW
jgi:hypothetical protein